MLDQDDLTLAVEPPDSADSIALHQAFFADIASRYPDGNPALRNRSAPPNWHHRQAYGSSSASLTNPSAAEACRRRGRKNEHERSRAVTARAPATWRATRKPTQSSIAAVGPVRPRRSPQLSE